MWRPFFIAASLCFLACHDDPAPSAQVSVREEPCIVALPGETLRCYRLDVPERYDAPEGRRLSLPFVVLPALGASRRDDSVVYLNGGPGSSGIGWLAVVAQQRDLRSDRDLIVFEQRGNGLAEPALLCGPSEAPRACHDRLVASGVDLSQYVTSIAARDVTELRQALGVRAWNLFGISYGTTLALSVLKIDEAGTRRVVLDSPTAPTVNIARADQESQLDAFTTLFEACVADEACNAAYPKLRARFLTLVDALDLAPWALSEGTAGALGTPELSGAALVSVIARGLQFGPRLVAATPALLAAIERRDESDFVELIGDLSIPQPEGFPEDRATALGLTLSIYCAELGTGPVPEPLVTREVWPDAVKRALAPDYAQTCADGAWPVPPIAEADREVVRSAVPTLLLAGRFDPVTPRRQAEIAAEGLSQATLRELSAATHGTTEHSACAARLLAQFIRGTPLEACEDEPFAFVVP